MNTDADRVAAEKAVADKRVADEAAASAAATANWPIGGYNTLIPLLFISMCAVLVFCVDDSTISLVHDNIADYQYVYVMLMIYSWINLIGNLLIFLTIQKPNFWRAIFDPRFCRYTETSPVYADVF